MKAHGEYNNNGDDDDVGDIGCCGRFWGPFRPLVGGHTLGEAATSSILPHFIVVLYRTLFTIFLGSTFVYYFLRGQLDMKFFTNWSHLGLSITFAFLTALSLLYLCMQRDTHSSSPQSSMLGTVGVILLQVFGSTALFLDVVYWGLLYDSEKDQLDLRNLTGHAFNLVCVLLEMMLSLRVNFKLFYILFVLLYVVSFLAFMWIRYAVGVPKEFVYGIYDYRDKPPTRVAVYYTGSVAWALVSGFVILLLSRLNRLPCVPQFASAAQQQQGTSWRRNEYDEEPRHDVENGRPFDHRI